MPVFTSGNFDRRCTTSLYTDRIGLEGILRIQARVADVQGQCGAQIDQFVRAVRDRDTFGRHAVMVRERVTQFERFAVGVARERCLATPELFLDDLCYVRTAAEGILVGGELDDTRETIFGRNGLLRAPRHIARQCTNVRGHR